MFLHWEVPCEASSPLTDLMAPLSNWISASPPQRHRSPAGSPETRASVCSSHGSNSICSFHSRQVSSFSFSYPWTSSTSLAPG